MNPAHSAYTFRPENGPKAVVTCRARPIIPELFAVEHLDLEAGELAGDFQVTWSSHDVAVSAGVRLAVQGQVAVAKIKFTTHARDTEYPCRALVDMISCRDILDVFCAEPLTAPVQPSIGPVLVEGAVRVQGDGWATFFNSRGWPRVIYDRAPGELRVELGAGARNNWKPDGVEHLEVIRRHAARIIWLNPAPRESWDTEDSIVARYAPYCRRLLECRNLRQLAAAARYIARI